MITLDFGAEDVLDLPSDLSWADRNAVTVWAQDQDRTLTGALVVESFEGSCPPITLASGASYGWASTTLVEALRTRFESALEPITLTIGTGSYTVLLDLAAGGFEAQPRKVRPADTRPAADWWLITLHFRRLAVL